MFHRQTVFPGHIFFPGWSLHIKLGGKKTGVIIIIYGNNRHWKTQSLVLFSLFFTIPFPTCCCSLAPSSNEDIGRIIHIAVLQIEVICCFCWGWIWWRNYKCEIHLKRDLLNSPKVRNVMDCGAFLCSKTLCFKGKLKTGTGSIVVCVPDWFWKLMEDNMQQRLRALNLFLTGRWYQWLSSKSHSHPESLQDKSGFGAWETWKKQPWRRWSWGIDPSKPKHFAHIHAEKAKNLSDGASWCSKMSLIFLKLSVWQQEKRGYLRYLCVLLEVWSLCVGEPLELDIKVLCRQTSARETSGGRGWAVCV